MPLAPNSDDNRSHSPIPPFSHSLHLTINLDESKQSPTAFLWQERLHRITGILERWRTVGAWWDGEGERTIFRVTVENGGIFEISYEHGGGWWNLERVED